MNPAQRQAWIREALDMAFQALASWPELRDKLVYKGGRVLALRLGGEQRASYDLDANLLLAFAIKHPDRNEQAEMLRDLFTQAIQAHAETQDPVRYELVDVRVKHRPRADHPLGWNAFEVVVKLRDFMNEGVQGLPNIEFDVAAPEELGTHAVAPLGVGGDTVFAYTLERIAGEKMRAFLSSLPSYRHKVKKPGDAVRAKDLYDVTKILGVHPIGEVDFWKAAAEEFHLACASRYIDCTGIGTFAEDIDVTRSTYETDATLPKDIVFDAAWHAIEDIVRFWEAQRVFPLRFPLPNGNSGQPGRP
ncbi:nucleotidyl transferase AbiEii/AbiGii toxin family protein [Frateuria sp. Soil773]|uniref:nucleotidyl transferase AbiEii/AbiGii toxin family protein n=1 Tax=Frateuria sp. Soil773 TaxID=1736407 RepID=UPI00138F2FE9|nr:nucleotidyl transferase AbiEii/AbiGii toxin family protein [Frateuria sp. Soil773]